MTLSDESFLLTTGAAFATPLDALRSRLEAGVCRSCGARVRSASSGEGCHHRHAASRVARRLQVHDVSAGPATRWMTAAGSRRCMTAWRPSRARTGESSSCATTRVGPGAALIAPAYDAAGGGGTTTTVFDPVAEKVVSTRASLAGTIRNCAGGPTPWGSWLTCEESIVGPGDRENPLRRSSTAMSSRCRTTASPTPSRSRQWAASCTRRSPSIRKRASSIRLRIVHRPACTDTFRKRRAVGGGRTLQMLAVDGRRGFDTSRGQRAGAAYDIHWVDIAEPDRPHLSATSGYGLGVLQQGIDRGGALFSRLEGATFGDGRLYVTATDGGEAQHGSGMGDRSAPRTIAAGLSVSGRAGAEHAGQHRAQSARGARALRGRHGRRTPASMGCRARDASSALRTTTSGSTSRATG